MPDLPPQLAPLRAHAQTVRCPRHRCHAHTGHPCVNPRTGRPLTIQPAHDERVRLADEQAARRHVCDPDRGGCGAPTGAPCKARPPFASSRLPVHTCRLIDADVWRAPVPRHQLLGLPRRRDPDAKLAAGIAERDRYAAEKAREHAADRPADPTPAVDLDDLDDDDPSDPLWVRGPGGPR